MRQGVHATTNLIIHYWLFLRAVQPGKGCHKRSVDTHGSDIRRLMEALGGKPMKHRKLTGDSWRVAAGTPDAPANDAVKRTILPTIPGLWRTLLPAAVKPNCRWN